MLALDLVEQGSGDGRIATAEAIARFRIQRLDVARDIGGVAGAVVAARTSGGEERSTRKRGAEDELVQVSCRRFRMLVM